MSSYETTPLVPSTTDDTLSELDYLLEELEKRYPDSSTLISVEVFADWLSAQLKPPGVAPLFDDDDLPDFSRGSGNKARRRAEALGLTIPAAVAAKCDACHDQGEVWAGETAYQGEWQPPEPVMERCPECGYGDELEYAHAASLVECDACPTSGGCVGTCMKAPAPVPPAPDPFDELPDLTKGCPDDDLGRHNGKGPKDVVGNLTCTCGLNWGLPF